MQRIAFIEGAGGIESQEAVGVPTVTSWFAETLAPSWFQDAVTATSTAAEFGGRRREIVFAVAAAESFLIEWTRDVAFGRDLISCRDFLKSRRPQPILDRWRDIPRELLSEGLVKTVQDLGKSSAWGPFRILVNTRNALVHGNYSQPQPSGDAPDLRHLSPEDLRAVPAGWAVGVVRDLVEEFCSGTGTDTPEWVQFNVAT